MDWVKGTNTETTNYMATHENWDRNDNYGFAEVRIDLLHVDRLETGDPYKDKKTGKMITPVIAKFQFNKCTHEQMMKKQTHDLKIQLTPEEEAKRKAWNLANPDNKKYAPFGGGITQLKGNGEWNEKREPLPEGTKLADVLGTNASPIEF